MIDLETLEEKCQVGIENKVNVEFSISYLNVRVNGTGYKDKVKIQDNYISEERSYSLGYSTEMSDLIEKEKKKAEQVEQAKELENTMEINGWRQVETEGSTFIKFINATKEVELRLNDNDTWVMNGKRKDSIKKAKYDMVKELQARNPVAEIVNKVACEELKKWLKNVDGIGDTISRRMASKAKAAADGEIESIDDVHFRRPKNVEYSLTTDAQNYFNKLNHDPIEEAVLEKKRELVQEHGQSQLVSEAL